jgi:hypothetical protein
MTNFPSGSPGQPAASSTVGPARYCIQCAYALVGLPDSGNCPECGTSIALSLRESTLTNATPEYQRTVLRGLSLVLNGILLMIIVIVAGFFSAMLAGAMGGAGGGAWIPLALQGVLLGVSAMILLGYYLYTTPDPGQVSMEATHSARTVVRITVVAQAALALVNLGIEALGYVSAVGQDLLGILSLVLGLVGMGLWAVQFFAVMRYTRWLGTRVPDFFVMRRTKLYMWLLPVLYIPGALVVGIGPLVALVLYWNLLDRMRKHLKSIVADGTPAPLKKMMPVGG